MPQFSGVITSWAASVPPSDMNLTAIFESWHIGDGNYPPLYRGQLVNLSFEIEPKNIEKTDFDTTDYLEDLGNGEYRFCGKVLKIYQDDDSEKIIVIQATNFRFYFVDYEARSLNEGNKIYGKGTLLLDHYIWVEFLRQYEDAPDLFYNLRVQRIAKVNTPERFITRHENGKSYPIRLKPENYSASDVEELETMENQAFNEEFYIIEFDGTGLEGQNIKHTFIN